MMNHIDYYEVLEISKNADEQEIKAAYRRLSLKYHPDRQSSKSDSEKKLAEEKFKEITQAYSCLSDQQKKSKYDQSSRKFNPFFKFKIRNDCSFIVKFFLIAFMILLQILYIAIAICLIPVVILISIIYGLYRMFLKN